MDVKQMCGPDHILPHFLFQTSQLIFNVFVSHAAQKTTTQICISFAPLSIFVAVGDFPNNFMTL
jgi:hypothetical protein